MTEAADPNPIPETLAALGVERVIVVDDDVDVAKAAAELIRAKVGIREARTVLIEIGRQRSDLELLGLRDELTDDDEELRQSLDRIWTELTEEDHRRIIEATPVTEDDSDAVTPYLAQIREYLPTDLEFIAHPAGDWIPANYDALFAEEKPTLVFFDQNLSNARLGEAGGEKLLAELLARKLPGVFCGLLTQEVHDLAKESSESSRLGSGATPAVPVLGKFRLESAQQFALGMQAFGLANDLHLLRSHVLSSAEGAMRTALETTGTLAYVTLLASARSAYGEGLYEGAGVGRMLFTALRRGVETAMMSNAPTESVDRIRKVMGTKLDLGHPDPSEVGPVEDAFESAEHLNAILAPTEVGDIYEFSPATGQNSFYILLAQPCDLMVRSRGRRDNETGYFVLARLMPEGESPAKQEDGDDEEYHHALRTLAVGKIPGQVGNWKINLADRAFMPPELLDACVLNPDGKSRIPTTIPDTAIPTDAWTKWRKQVDKWGVNKVESARLTPLRFPGKKLAPEQQQLVVDLVVKGDLGRQFVDGKVTIDARVDPDEDSKKHELSAGIARIGRLSAAHAKALLIQYSHFHTRPDLPVALLKVADPSETQPSK